MGDHRLRPQCSRKGCTRQAVCVPQLQVPPEGHAFRLDALMTMIVDLPLCQSHFDSQSPAEIFDPATKEGSTMRLKALAFTAANGRAPPAFDRARIMPLSMNDPGYLRQKRASAAKRAGAGPGLQ